MNPIKKFQHLIIGKALSKTDDVFEKARIFVLYNFTVVFLVLNIPYLLQTLSVGNGVHIALAVSSTIALSIVLVILSKSENITIAVYFYLFNHASQNLFHYLIVIEMFGL